MVVGYEKTSFGAWGFRTLFVRLLARRHCIGHGVLLGRSEVSMSPFHAIMERLGRYKMDGAGETGRPARPGRDILQCNHTGQQFRDRATIDRKNSAMQTDSLNH